MKLRVALLLPSCGSCLVAAAGNVILVHYLDKCADVGLAGQGLRVLTGSTIRLPEMTVCVTHFRSTAASRGLSNSLPVTLTFSIRATSRWVKVQVWAAMTPLCEEVGFTSMKWLSCMAMPHGHPPSTYGMS